jgi:hypothetical protein
MATEDQPVCTGITFLSYVKSIVCPGAQTVAFEESTLIAYLGGASPGTKSEYR